MMMNGSLQNCKLHTNVADCKGLKVLGDRPRGEETSGSKNSVQTHQDDPLQRAPAIKFLQQESQLGQCVIDFPKGSASTPSDPWDSFACESLLFSQACSHK